MATQEVRFTEAVGQGAEPEGGRAPGGSARSAAAGCCGPGMTGGMTEMMQACPCGAVFRRHRRAIWVAMAAMAFGFAVLQAGWVLGVIAFFRTF